MQMLEQSEFVLWTMYTWTFHANDKDALEN